MKKILILILLIVLTGCSSDLNIIINSDNSVEENITIINDNIPNIELSKSEYLDELIEFNGVDSNYKLNKIVEDNYIGVELDRDYIDNNICDSLRDSSLSKLMSDFKCKKEDEMYIIYGNVNYFACDENCFEPPEITDGTVNITLPNKAKKHNANEVNGNTYTWHFDGSKDQMMELEFKIKGSSKNDTYNVDLIKTTIVLVLGILVIGIIVGIILYNKYQKNKLEY